MIATYVPDVGVCAAALPTMILSLVVLTSCIPLLSWVREKSLSPLEWIMRCLSSNTLAVSGTTKSHPRICCTRRCERSIIRVSSFSCVLSPIPFFIKEGYLVANKKTTMTNLCSFGGKISQSHLPVASHRQRTLTAEGTRRRRIGLDLQHISSHIHIQHRGLS